MIEIKNKKVSFDYFIEEEIECGIVLKGTEIKSIRNGQANIKDILAINKHRLNKAQLVNEYLQAGDINEDGKVDIRDILQINKYRLGKISEL